MVEGSNLILKRCSKNLALMHENEGCKSYNRRRNEQPHEKHDNSGKHNHHNLTMESPTDRGPTTVQPWSHCSGLPPIFLCLFFLVHPGLLYQPQLFCVGCLWASLASFLDLLGLTTSSNHIFWIYKIEIYINAQNKQNYT